MRTKTVFPSDEVAHIWAKQSQDEGRNAARNIFFNGKDIYSYCYHFCMGRIVDSNTVLLTDRRYSNTTDKHLSHTRYAVNHFENRIYIPYPEKTLTDKNAIEIIAQIKTQLEILSNTRKKAETKERAKNELASIVHNVERYAAVTKQPIDSAKTWGAYKDLRKEFLIYFNAAKNNGELDLNKALASLESSRKRAETIKAKKAQKAREESLKLWLKGDNSYTVKGKVYELDNVYLRVTYDFAYDDGPKQTIETTKGATVSLREGKILFDMIKAGKDIKGHVIDGYTVIGLNGVLTIGCHKIERAEIERFAKTQNWI